MNNQHKQPYSSDHHTLNYEKWIMNDPFSVYCNKCSDYVGVSLNELISKQGGDLPTYEDIICESCGARLDLFQREVIDAENHTIKCSKCAHLNVKSRDFLLQWKEWAQTGRLGFGYTPEDHGNILCYEGKDWESWQFSGGNYFVNCKGCSLMLPTTREELEANGVVIDEEYLHQIDKDDWKFDGTFVAYCHHCSDYVYNHEAFEYATAGIDIYQFIECPSCGEFHMNPMTRVVSGNERDGYDIICSRCGFGKNVSREELLAIKNFVSQSGAYPNFVHTPEHHGNILCFEERDWNNWEYDWENMEGEGTYVVYCNNCSEMVSTSKEELEANGVVINEKNPHQIDKDDWKFDGTFVAYCHHCSDYIYDSEAFEYATAGIDIYQLIECPSCGGYHINPTASGSAVGNEQNGCYLVCSECGYWKSVSREELLALKNFVSQPGSYPNFVHTPEHHGNILCFEEEDEDNWLFDGTAVVYCNNCSEYGYNEGGMDQVYNTIGKLIGCPSCWVIDPTAPQVIEGSETYGYHLVCPYCSSRKNMTREQMLQLKQYVSSGKMYPNFVHTPDHHGNILCFEEINWENWEYDGTYVVYCNNCSEMVPTSKEELEEHGVAIDEQQYIAKYCDSCQQDVYLDPRNFSIDLENDYHFIPCSNCDSEIPINPQEIGEIFNSMADDGIPEYNLELNESKGPVTLVAEAFWEIQKEKKVLKVIYDTKPFGSGDYEQAEYTYTIPENPEEKADMTGWFRIGTQFWDEIGVQDAYAQFDIPSGIFKSHLEHNFAGAKCEGNIAWDSKTNRYSGAYNISSKEIGFDFNFSIDKSGKPRADQEFTVGKKYFGKFSTSILPKKLGNGGYFNIEATAGIRNILFNGDQLYLTIKPYKLDKLLKDNKNEFIIGYKWNLLDW